MSSVEDLLNKSIPELNKLFVERRRRVPKGLLEALDVDRRQGAQQLAKRIRERYRENRAEGQRLHFLLRFEIELWADGYGFVAGVDEAGMAPLAGLDGGGFMADLLLVPYADAMLVGVPDAVDPVAIASLSDNIPDGWRAVGPYRMELAALDPADRRVLVAGRLSIGLYAAAFASAYGAQVDYVDTDPQRLTMAEKLGATVHDTPKPEKSSGPYPVTVHTSAEPAVLAATLRVTWPDGVCTDTGIYYQGAVEMPLLPMYTRGVRFVTGRFNARTVIPEVVELLEAGCDLAPAVDRVVPWDEAADVWPPMTGKTVFTR